MYRKKDRHCLSHSDILNPPAKDSAGPFYVPVYSAAEYTGGSVFDSSFYNEAADACLYQS